MQKNTNLIDTILAIVLICWLPASAFSCLVLNQAQAITLLIVSFVVTCTGLWLIKVPLQPKPSEMREVKISDEFAGIIASAMNDIKTTYGGGM